MKELPRAGEARARLRERFSAAPAAVLRALAADPPPLPFDPRALRRLRTTGIGSSESHARALAWLCAERLGLDARFTPAGALREGRLPDCERDALIVFSQGLSPNARFALSAPRCWGGALLVTAVTREGGGPERAAWLRALEAAGVGVVRFEPENEYDALVRIAGPLCGLAAAFGVARALARSLGSESALEQASPDAVAARIAAAESLLDAALSDLPADALARRFVLLATGGYAALASNLKQKILEGLLRPLPPAFDVLEFAHGPFQQCFEDSVCFLALLRDDAPDEPLWMERLQGMLEPSRHALLPLRATLPGLYALFEHEAWLDALVLRRLETENPDPARWPGRGRDAPLYRAAPQAPAAPAPAPPVRAAPVELGSAVWPELETALAGGACAVVPLGAIEQHGPHLPFATDTWIADALAVRLCARLPGCVALPAVSLGCSPEHADFPGTLALRAETLEAVLADAIVSLARHGVSRVFVFSAHGGNAEALRAALPRLREAACDAARECGHAAPRVLAHTDLAGLTRALHRAAADQGVGPGEAGHHAGEIETSILLALRPGAVRREAFAPGTLAPQPDAQALFHPSLRARAPSGTVGDPRRADAARGARYLEAWTDVLVACIREGEAP